MKNRFLEALNARPLLFDGATGTMLQRLGLKPGGCPDELSLKDPAMVRKVHAAYIEAGSDIVTTNTFGANRAKLAEYGLEGKLKEINVAAAQCAREEAGRDRFVAGGFGPTGRFVEPVGDMSFDETLSIFIEQAEALKLGGADLAIIETMMDIKEMKAAIMAAKSVGLPVVATMTFDQTMRTVLGTPPESFAIMAAALGADCIGANCSLGIEGIYQAVSAMSKVVDIPLIAQPNAGLPMLRGTETVFPASPEEMASFVPKLVDSGVRVLGGCCGTTSEHIRKMGTIFKSLQPVRRERKNFTALASRTSFTLFGGGLPAIVIGERINPTGRKALAQEIKEGKTAGIRNEARAQAVSGAHALDVNVGVPGIDEIESMSRAVFAVNENSTLPIAIDSSSPEAIEAGLKAADGRPLVNSISGEEKKLSTILPLAKKYGAAVLALTLDDSGIPDTAEGRVAIAERILNKVLEAGMRKEDLIVDCLAMTVSAAPLSAIETLKAIRLLKDRLGLTTVLGVSNISFGLPAREVINASFLTMAIAAGLDSAIINPNNKAMMDAYHSSLVLLNQDVRAERYIKRHQEMFRHVTVPDAATGHDSVATNPQGLEARLKKAVIEGDEENIVAIVEEALKEGWDPIKISGEGLVPGLEEVGRLFGCNKYYLPQVMLSADTMKKAFARLKKELKGKSGPSLGKVVLATVEGDIHDIGKNILATLLENHGFEVIDLGKNVSSARIVEEAVRHKADIVGLSALMTTTVMEMDKVIKELKDKGVKVMTIVGGAVVTKEFSDKVKADEYGGDALSAVDKMKKMMMKR
ncbi:MAG: 5-methyltetrahydrofolate--homocysteine methyltransferase [Deltaproteobacteria bacterium GWC2_56_8]|nr:MAG: 5-methyltetrahydrofolate--homocysteine methyltransferase [Deltaproteobacteria bacterium GWB2_55_19]OGP35679.1 MAG: 5-methyltetrahydrofolate--homocysteine methyltransferase [Deltaproteobacteria bacterium GWC2_56_8]HAO93951.1 5-methyltetrahydrofolate--homocysteine methyltransferase [Deltaproteobacteria bacterium]